MKFPALLALGILCCCCSSSYAVDCTSKESLEAAQSRCFSLRGLEVSGASGDLQNAVQNNPEYVCQNRDNYKEGLRCAMNMAKNCLVQVGQSTDILPDVDKLLSGITYLCDNIHNVDSQCVKDKQGALRQCAINKALSAFSGSSNLDITKIVCKSFEIAVECLQQSMRSCRGQTMVVVVHYAQNYATPPACHTGPQPDPGYGFSTVAPMTTAQLVTMALMLPHVSCYSQSGIQEGQQKCFQQEGINVTLPEVNLSDGHTKQSFLDAMLTNNRDIHQMCRKLPHYQRAMGCAWF